MHLWIICFYLRVRKHMTLVCFLNKAIFGLNVVICVTVVRVLRSLDVFSVTFMFCEQKSDLSAVKSECTDVQWL